MAIAISDNYKYLGKKPNFSRDLFATVDEMVAISENYLPSVFECNVTEDGKRYRYNVANEVDPVLGKWRVVGDNEDLDLADEIDPSTEPVEDDKNRIASVYAVQSIEYAKHSHIYREENKDKYFKLIENDDGELEIGFEPVSSDGGTAETTTYEFENDSVSYSNVKEVLDDYLAEKYYVAPSITSFTAFGSGSYEVGYTLTGTTFNWAYNKGMTSQSLTDCPDVSEDTLLRTAYLGSLNITSATPYTKTYTLSAGDGKNSVTKSVSFQWQYRVYYGVTEKPNAWGETPLSKLSSKLGGYTGTYSIRAMSSTERFFIVIPNALRSSATLDIKINGFTIVMEKLSSFNFTNQYGVELQYNVYYITDAYTESASGTV